MNRALGVLLICLATLATPVTTVAEPERVVSFQAAVTDSMGLPLPEDIYDVVFRIWDAPSGGNVLWWQGQNLLITDSIITTRLGITSWEFPPNLFTETRYLGLEIDGAGEMPARIQVAGSPFAMHALTVADSSVTSSKIGPGTVLRSLNGLREHVDLVAGDGISITEVGGDLAIGATGTADPVWGTSGDDAYLELSGNVGIGTTSPTSKVDVREDGGAPALTVGPISTNPSNARVRLVENPGATFGIDLEYDGTANQLHVFGVESGLQVGPHLTINRGTGNSIFYNSLNFLDDNDVNRIRLDGQTGSVYGLFQMFDQNGTSTLELKSDRTASGGGSRLDMLQDTGAPGVRAFAQGATYGGGVIEAFNAASSRTVQIVGDHDGTGQGRVITNVVEITGGSDLSERFDVRPADDTAVEPLPGSVVCIDPERPGALVVSDGPYDRRVAGVISGAGDVRPGMLMGQPGTVADGEHPIALTGRVYARADAAFGSIEPGDLLTTSATPGCAMKVTDHSRANGAILGKAMTPLPDGVGLVLVLVSLQ